MRTKSIRGQKYLYLVESQWDSKKKTSRQNIIKYLGIESNVSIHDIPENYQNSKKIIDYFTNQKYFQPTVQNEITEKLQKDLLILFQNGDHVQANSALQSYEKIYGFESFLTHVLTPLIQQIDSLGISKIDVSILASIVEEEQDKRIDERSIIAGLYLNRLVKYHPDIGQGNKGKLQADPTLIFAIGDFKIKRVLDEDKKIDSPFNTYLNKGLPPGPICIPSIDAIDAVLNAVNHDYFFMCAKEDFSGYHNFACCYKRPHKKSTCNKEENTHLENSKKFHKELNRREVWR